MSEQENTTEKPQQDLEVRHPLVWHKISVWILKSCFTLLILCAVLLSSGRMLMPLVSSQQANIEQQLAGLLGTEVSIGKLAGSWRRLGPIIEIGELRIINPEDPAASQVLSSLSIKPALLASLLSRSLVIEQVTLQEPEINLSENVDGSWTLAGLPMGENDYTDAIIDFLLTTGRLQIVEASLGLRWADGRSLDLTNIYIDFSNAGNLHRTRIQARIDTQDSPFQLQLDLIGDPRTAFDGSAWLRANNLEIAGLLPAADLSMSSAVVDGDFWFEFRESAFYSAQASVQSLALAGRGNDESAFGELALANASMELSVLHDSENNWQAWVDNAEFDWQNRPWAADGIYLNYAQDGESQPLSLAADSVDVAMLWDVLDDLVVIPQRAMDILGDLAPVGELANLSLDTDISGNFEGGFLLKANLVDVAVGAWQGAPSAQGIQGYVQANTNSGFVELDTDNFDIHLPRLFTDGWHFDSASSRVGWLVEDGTVRVNSSIIDVRNDYIHGHVQFDLFNRPDSAGDMQSELTLLIGVLEMDAAFKSLLLPEMDRIRTTMDWLDAALLAGDISNSGFVSRTSTRGNAPANSGTVMSFYNVENGELKFQPDWPELNGINAFVKVDNNNVDVEALAAEIEGISLQNTLAVVRPNAESGSLLTVTGNAAAATSQGLAFLRNTPVRNDIGDFIDDWQGEGNVQVDIELGIPLNSPDLQTQVLVNVLSDKSTLTIPEYSLAITDLRGRIVFDSEAGLSASALSGNLFDFPIAATIEPLVNEAGDVITGTRIVGSGRASRSALQAWEGQPDFVRNILNLASGEIDYLAEISIPYTNAAAGNTTGTSLRLTSELLGLALDFPHPFNKTVDQIRPLELRIDFSDEEEWISARFDNRVGANLLITGDSFNSGKVMLGPDVRLMNFGPVTLDRPGLSFSGFLDRFNYEEWENTATRFNELAMAGSAEARLEDFLSLADVRIGELEVIDQLLEDAQTQVTRISSSVLDPDSANPVSVADSWRVSVTNEKLSGDFIFPDDDNRPWDINLAYLRFPESEEETAEQESEGEELEDIDILADVNPADIPDINFQTMELVIGDKDLGAWEFVLRNSGDGASISELRMTTPDARITDNSLESGANLNWQFSDGLHTSSFTGLFSAGDLASVLPGWGYDANVESESAAFTSNFQWSGSPAAFDLEKIIGNVQVDIQNGRFVDVDAGTSRLFGAFSFDSLVRRLQLDFSDLYERGLAYDEITGRLDFNDGIVRSNGAFVIAGPSSRITIDGEIDLVNETIDADMLVNVPFGQNVSVLAGILGAWPIAVGSYIASRLFRNQMDEFTTVVYRLEGPWDNPASGFEPSDEILEAEQDAETQQAGADSTANSGNTEVQ